MSSPKAPEPPNYVAAAQAQGAANLQAAIASGMLNNPNINNPYGEQSVTWKTVTGPDGKTKMSVPTLNQKLSPDQQKILNQSNLTKQQLGAAGNRTSKLIQNNLWDNLDFSKLPGAPKNSGQRREDVIAAMMARVGHDTNIQRDDVNSKLIAAGIRPGTEAYKNSMDQIDRQYNDARSNAILAGGQEATRDFGMDQQTRNQALTEMMTKRTQPLNELNATLSGSQVSSPFAAGLGYQAGQQVGAAPVANAITNQGQAQQNIYNANQASANNNLNAGAGLLGSLGSAWLMKPQ